MGAFLRDVGGFEAVASARLVSVIGIAMMAGCVGSGWAARHLERLGISLYAFAGAGMAALVAVQLLPPVQVPLPPVLL